MAEPTTTQTPQTKAKAKAKPGEKAKSKLMIVRSTLPSTPDGGDPVVLHEQDDRHPGGFAFVSGKTPVEVFPTTAVLQALKDEKLKDITDGDEPDDEEDAE